MKRKKNNKKGCVLKAIINTLIKIITAEWFWVIIIEKVKDC